MDAGARRRPPREAAISFGAVVEDDAEHDEYGPPVVSPLILGARLSFSSSAARLGRVNTLRRR
jgi:hypothetical protein